jgi:hypothetical protein
MLAARAAFFRAVGPARMLDGAEVELVPAGAVALVGPASS